MYWDLARPSVDKGKSLVWICSSGLMGGTESLMLAAQGQTTSTNYHQWNIMKRAVGSKCRMAVKQNI
jgi:hypothetical protein